MCCHDQVQDFILPSWEVHCLFEVVYNVKGGLTKYVWVLVAWYSERINIWAVKISTS